MPPPAQNTNVNSQAPREFVDIRFPQHGVDVSMELESQRSGTTPLGNNVRVFETLTMRGRGGFRSGLRKFIPGPVATIAPNNPEPIQNLTLIVDPFGQLTPFPFDNVPGFMFNNLDPSNLGRNLLFDGSIGDIYIGGSGNVPNVKRPPVPKVTITPDNQTKSEGSTFTFTGTEFTVDSGITNYRSYLAGQVSVAQGQADARAAAYNDAQAASDADPGNEALAAYAQAALFQSIKAAAAVVAAQVLKELADDAQVDTVTLTSTGAGPDAGAGVYVIKASEAQGVNLKLFRLKYATGNMTVTPPADEITITINGTPHTASIVDGGFSFSEVLPVTFGFDFYKLTASGEVTGSTITAASWLLQPCDAGGTVIGVVGVGNFSDSTFTPGTPYTVGFVVGVYYGPGEPGAAPNNTWSALYGANPGGLRTAINLTAWLQTYFNVPNFGDVFYGQQIMSIVASMAI